MVSQWKAGLAALQGAPSKRMTDGRELGQFLDDERPAEYLALQPWSATGTTANVDMQFLRQAALKLGAVPRAMIEQVQEYELVEGRARWRMIGGTVPEEDLIGLVRFNMPLAPEKERWLRYMLYHLFSHPL